MDNQGKQISKRILERKNQVGSLLRRDAKTHHKSTKSQLCDRAVLREGKTSRLMAKSKEWPGLGRLQL